MSELVLGSEPLSRIIEGKTVSVHEYVEAYKYAAANPGTIYRAASDARHAHKGRTITFSKKVFLNVINLCRDTCSYCTYKAQPGQSKLSMMEKNTVQGTLETASRYKCVEALLVTGERPEERYAEARSWLHAQGYSSTPQYLEHVSGMALEAGLFPHTNAGNLEAREMRQLARTNVSIGLMLESTSSGLGRKGMAHHLAPSKDPGTRLRVLQEAGRLRIPTTTGILVGIGQSVRDDIESLLAILKIHQRYGHIQEIILQNFQPKEDTAMRARPPADGMHFSLLVALARIMMPDMNIQIPPNLSPSTYHTFINPGINDWGGVSPLTPDYVNPEFAWPAISDIEDRCRQAGYALRCRFPVYPEFTHMCNRNLQERMRAVSDDKGLVEHTRWR